jgi:hypothetical protein
MSNFELLKTQHTSLQFSDNSRQQKLDIRDLFTSGEDYPIKTGTEAGVDNDNHQWLQHFANEFNHALHFGRDCWIAVDRAIIKRDTFRRGGQLIAKNQETWGRGHDTFLATVEFDHKDDRIGHISQGSVHYALRGAEPGNVNYEINKRSAQLIYNWMVKSATGPNLAFVNGDFNVQDDKFDWAYGKGFTSMADELKAWQNTGHGPIDGFASYDRDGRVKAESFNVLDDKEMFQFSDHFVCRGVWKIKHLRTD